MTSSLQTPFFQNIHAYTDQSAFFDTVRSWPIVSTVPSLTEAALNTALAITALPVVLALQIARILPLPEVSHESIIELASDSLHLLQIFMANVALAVTSAIPFAGNYITHQLAVQKRVIMELHASESQRQQPEELSATAADEDDEEMQQLREGAALLQQVGAENEELRRENERLREILRTTQDQYEALLKKEQGAPASLTASV